MQLAWESNVYVEEASRQAIKQPSSNKQIQGMMAIQDPAKQNEM